MNRSIVCDGSLWFYEGETLVLGFKPVAGPIARNDLWPASTVPSNFRLVITDWLIGLQTSELLQKGCSEHEEFALLRYRIDENEGELQLAINETWETAGFKSWDQAGFWLDPEHGDLWEESGEGLARFCAGANSIENFRKSKGFDLYAKYEFPSELVALVDGHHLRFLHEEVDQTLHFKCEGKSTRSTDVVLLWVKPEDGKACFTVDVQPDNGDPDYHEDFQPEGDESWCHDVEHLVWWLQND
ncbi:MAG TPA: hypothetical protein VEH27_00640 [Methylomirabilota bacterium]|nr:hypothetical protein [Methylomirabilota bacterium]